MRFPPRGRYRLRSSNCADMSGTALLLTKCDSRFFDYRLTEIVIQPLLESRERGLSVFCRRPRRRHECRGRRRELYCFSRASVYRRSRDSRECDQHALSVGRNYGERGRLSPKAEYSEAHSDSSGDYQFGRRALGSDSPHPHARPDFLARDSLAALGRHLALRPRQASHRTHFRWHFARCGRRGSHRRFAVRTPGCRVRRLFQAEASVS